MATCAEYRLWMRGADRDESPPDDLREHAESCAGCRALSGAYRRATAGIRDLATYPAPSGPDMAQIRRRLNLPTRATRVRQAAQWVVPVAAVAAVATWLVLPGIPQSPSMSAAVEPAPSLSAPVAVEPSSPATPAVPERTPEAAPAVATGQTLASDERDVTIQHPQVGTVRLTPHTRVRVASFEHARSVFFLDDGQIEATVAKRSTGQVFEVHTSYAVVRVTGTRFLVTHRPDQETVVTTLEGRVLVETFAKDRIATVVAGQVLRVDSTRVVGPDPIDGRLASATVRPRGRTAEPIKPEPVAAAPDPSATAATAATAPDAPRLSAAETIAMARSLLGGGRVDDALDLLNRALAADAGNPALLALLGDAHRVGGRPEDAADAYERAVATGRAPESVDVDLAGLLQKDLDRPADAERAWKRYLEARPEGRYKGRALFELGRLAENAGRSADALALYRRVVEESPDSLEAGRALARVGRDLIQNGRLDQASAWFAAHRSSGSRDVAEAALVGLMRVAAQQGRHAEVLSLATEYRSRFPQGSRRSEVESLLTGIRSSH
jgi:Tfp pilus assembly protein PilF